MTAKRGVVFIFWGPRATPFFERAVASLRTHHPELPVHVERLDDHLDPAAGLLQKSRMADISPFETTLYLDVDTVVLGRLDFAFDRAERHGLACTICECPWASRYRGLSGDLIEYNTGVIFFTALARPVFEAWKRFSVELDSSIRHVVNGQVTVMPHNDQGGFAQAVDATGFHPFVLPLNWNLRPKWHRSFFGPVRIWHDYRAVPENLLEINRYYASPESIIQYHAFDP
jgi:hypothetical protein